jgi:hypothetical protein
MDQRIKSKKWNDTDLSVEKKRDMKEKGTRQKIENP